MKKGTIGKQIGMLEYMLFSIISQGIVGKRLVAVDFLGIIFHEIS